MDKVCVKSANGYKTKFRFTTIAQCKRAEQILRRRQESATIASELLTSTVDTTTSTTTTVNRSDSVILATMARSTSPTRTHPTHATTARLMTTTTESTDMKPLTDTKFIRNSTAAPKPMIMVTIPSRMPATNPSTTSPATTTSKNTVIRNLTESNFINNGASATVPHRVLRAISKFGSIKSISSPTMYSETTFKSSLSTNNEDSTTTTPLILLTSPSPHASSSSRPQKYEELYAKTWRAIVRAYTLTDRMEKIYHNLTYPLQQYLESSPIYKLINNSSSHYL